LRSEESDEGFGNSHIAKGTLGKTPLLKETLGNQWR
jgi:hypothetical protein